MSASSLLTSGSNLVSSAYLPQGKALREVLLQSGGAIAAPLTATVAIPADGLYITQVYIEIGGSGAAPGTGYFTMGVGADGWGNISAPAASITASANGNTFMSVGNLSAGNQTMTFTPTTGMNLGASGELAVRVFALNFLPF